MPPEFVNVFFNLFFIVINPLLNEYDMKCGSALSNPSVMWVDGNSIGQSS
jgi:hypothetical protein